MGGTPDLPADSSERARPLAPSVLLEFLDEVILPSGTRLPGDGPPVGGLSGCVLHPTSGELWAVSDDREWSGYFRFRIDVRGEHLQIAPVGFVRLRNEATILDLEGITLVPAVVSQDQPSSWQVVVSSEGNGRPVPTTPPSLLLFGKEGHVTSLPVPALFSPDPSGAHATGVRSNEAFESLTSTSGTIWTANEGPLVQDGPDSAFGRGARVRLLEFLREGDTWHAGRQLVYPLESTPLPPGFGASTLSTGLVDLLTLGANRLLALERSYVREIRSMGLETNRISLFEVDVSGADDVSAAESLVERSSARAVTKGLVLDFDALKPRLSERLQRLENFEGLCYGPPLDDGSRSVLVVSDDNFNQRQQTAFLLFRLRRP